ncbi:hypothetical protein FRC03_012390 [Tulasnella sp. 419]|nr:hypothetical protein FRC02_011861 [Tulasnella sp. 418]KAG8951760.1 hypothetical protein FRC03_012390 [Tulasnella sp. 419]
MQRDKSLGVECHPLNKDNHFAQPTPSPPPGQHSVPSETPGPQNESKNTFFKYTLPDIDDHVLFWSTYDKEAGEADAELLEEWNKSIDILLIFVGLDYQYCF